MGYNRSMSKHNVFLVGLMGTGKTTIGQHIARELGLVFYDTDAVIVERTGADINWIFDLEGEEGFRDREQAVVQELSALNHIVVATGGGTIVRPTCRQMLAANGVVIYLRTNIEHLLARTEKSRHRPLLNKGNRREAYEQLFAVREPMYAEIADLTYDTDHHRVVELGDLIIQDLKQRYEF